MKSLPIRNSSALQIGQNVGTIGYPFEQLPFSVGNIKINILRDTILGYVQTGMIQHGACGYHGSSEGPLLDLQGRVLGVNSYPCLQGYDIPGLTDDNNSTIILANRMTMDELKEKSRTNDKCMSERQI